LLLFLEKEDLPQRNIDQLLGAKPPWFRFAEGSGSPYPSGKQNLRFLLLFLEKEDY
jgi:hypothetical protein